MRSQAYGGIAAEHYETTAAVDKTRRQVLLYNGKVATTFFFSTSGGRTAAIQDAWPKSAPVPYLVSVTDPYDTLSPWHNWGPVLVDGAKLRKSLKLAAPVLDVTVTPGAAGRVASVLVTDSLGDEVTVPAATLRTLLGLRSTWFSVGVLSLAAAEAPVAYGSSVDLSGSRARSRRADAAAAARPADSGSRSAPSRPTATGAFQLTETPEASTDYRLVAGKANGPPLHVGVAPLVTLTALPGSAGVSGTVQPLLTGATVGLQQQVGTAWTTVTTATVDESGNFQAIFPLQAGALYRARVAPGQGFAVGAHRAAERPVKRVLLVARRRGARGAGGRGRVHDDRSARRPAVVPRPGPGVRHLAPAAHPRARAVAVIDSGIDGGHPEFAGRIVLAKSFVGGSALTDEQGHGTFVAGEIAASLEQRRRHRGHRASRRSS